MTFAIELFLFSLFIFVNQSLVRAFNETCGENNGTICVEPLSCAGGYCVCSLLGKSKNEKQPLAFWTGDQCITCPLDYITSGTKCYKLITGKDNQMNWIRARTFCQQSGGDLFVIRSEKEFMFVSNVLGVAITDNETLLRSPINGTRFASVWIGAKLADWRGAGTYQLVAHGPPITKDSFYWCSASSLLGQEPNHQGLKTTGEQQECVALAIFPDDHVCMHDWFCSWESFALCEMHPPAPIDISIDPGIESLAAKEKTSKDDKSMYLVIFGIILVVILIIIGVLYYKFRKKPSTHSRRSIDSSTSDFSES